MTGIPYIRSRAMLLSILCATFLAASALALPATSAEAEEDAGTLNIAVPQDAPDLNVFNLATNDIWKNRMFSSAFEGLAAIDYDYRPYPLLASSWTFFEGNLTVMLDIHDGVTFHDDQAMTADDVVFTYQALRDGTVYTSDLLPAFDQNADGYLSEQEMTAGVEKADDDTVIMRMAQPYGQFFTSTITIPIIPMHIWQDHLTAEGTVDVLWDDPAALTGTGPFLYDGGVAGEYRVMNKSDGYWGQDRYTPAGFALYPPNVDQMRFVIIPSMEDAVDAIKDGTVDYIASPIPSDTLDALAHPAVELTYMADNGYRFVAFNEKRDPLGSMEFRKAVAHLTDKDEIVDVLMGGLAQEGSSCLPPYWGAWFNSSAVTYWYDDPLDGSSTVPEDLLDSAGFVDSDGDGWRNLPNGTAMDPLVIMTTPASYDPVRARIGEMIAENLTAVGVDASAREYDFSLFQAKLSVLDYDIALAGWYLDQDPVGSVFDLLGPLSPQNYYGFWSDENPNPYYEDLGGVNTLADAETQALADLMIDLEIMATSTFDTSDQIFWTKYGQGVVSEAVPIDVLYYPVNVEATCKAWTGWTPSAGTLLNMFSLSELTVDPEPPVADAGIDQQAFTEDAVILDGCGSTDNIGIKDYEWTFVDGTETTLEGEVVGYTFSEPGEYVITLTVTDFGGLTDADTTIVTVTRAVGPPDADAGDDMTVREGETVPFDGSGSTDDSAIVSYVWRFVYDGDTVILTGVSTDFTFDIPDVYVVTLNVTDDEGFWDTDTVTVTVEANEAPVADAGDDPEDVMVGDTVTFDGSGSHDDMGIENYTWTVGDGSGTHLYGVEAQYTFEAEGEFDVTLAVSDADGLTDDDVVVVAVSSPNAPPVADAGLDVETDEGMSVTFDGTGSEDDDAIANWTWTFTYGDVTRSLYGETATFAFEVPGTYTVTLNVTDSEGLWDTDVVTVIVDEAPIEEPGDGPGTLQYWWVIAAAVGIAAIALIGAMYMLRTRRAPPNAP